MIVRRLLWRNLDRRAGRGFVDWIRGYVSSKTSLRDLRQDEDVTTVGGLTWITNVGQGLKLSRYG